MAGINQELIEQQWAVSLSSNFEEGNQLLIMKISREIGELTDDSGMACSPCKAR